MDASQYKDYVLVLLFVKYVSDKYAGQLDAPIEVPPGGSFAALGRKCLIVSRQSAFKDQSTSRIAALDWRLDTSAMACYLVTRIRSTLLLLGRLRRHSEQAEA